MADATSQTASSFDGTDLAVHRLGEGAPVVLLHGLFSDARMNWLRWGHAEQIAAKGYEVIMPDLRAHGRSAAAQDAAAYPRDVLVRDLEAVIDHLGLSDYDLGGFSLGARTVVQATATGVVSPRRLVVAGMGLAGLGDWQGRAAFFLRAIAERETVKQGDDTYFAVQFMRSQKIDPIAAEHLLRSPTDIARDALSDIGCPTLIVCGSEDRDNGSPEALADAIPDAEYVAVPGTHMSSVTKPELGEAIAGWLGPRPST